MVAAEHNSYTETLALAEDAATQHFTLAADAATLNGMD